MALFERVAIAISPLARFVGGGPSFLGISFSTSSSAEDGEVKIALNACDTRLLLSKWNVLKYNIKYLY